MLKIDNLAGVELIGGNQTISNSLTFANGKITTGVNKIILEETTSVTNSNPNANYVVGNLQRAIVGGGGGGYEFFVGDANYYSPVFINFTDVATGGDITVSTDANDHPDILNSGINNSKSVNRNWTVTNNGTVFNTSSNTATITLNWNAADEDAGITPANLIVAKYDDPTWILPTSFNQVGTSIQASGLTSFSDFQVGEAVCTVFIPDKL